LGVFKGAKHGIRAICVVLAVEVLIVCGFVIVYFINEDLDGLIKFAIAWLPTIIFLLIIVSSMLVGIRRGLRKSLILLLHSVLMAGVCLGLFFFCVTSSAVDKLLLDVINTFMGTNGLQNQLGVSAECETIREVLFEYLSDIVYNANNEIGILFSANQAYILTLINMAYRIVFAIVFFIIYQLLLFIMYIIYLICYPERRYKKKRNERFAMNKTDCSYNKRPIGGGCVGLVRGFVSAIISISFVGSIFFIATGGTGASKLPENFSLGEKYDPYISIYRSIEDYGEQGIFKILNAINDPEDTPYYLFAADIVFSGGLDDDLHEVSGNIAFRRELAAYTGFAKNTLALLLKYDTDGEIEAILNGQINEGKMNKILNVCLNPEFQVEFDNLIDNFDSQTYVINFALSLADAVIANIDDMSFMSSVSATNKELLQVLFRRNYLCDAIPDERERKASVSSEIGGEIPPYITINHLFTKKDAQIVLDVVLSILAKEINVDQPATLARVLIPYIEDLSILSSDRSKEFDPVLGRLYCYLDNKYLTDEGEDGIRYSEIKNESVYWTKELRALLSVSDGIFTMYDNVQNGENKDKNIFNRVISLFDEDGEEYAENMRIYEEVTDVVSDSALLSKALCSKKIYNYLYGQFKRISENVYIPTKITYENKYDKDGNLISHGEAYQLLRGLRLLADKDNRAIINSLLGLSSDSVEDGSDGESEDKFEDLIKKLTETLTKDDPYANGNSLASYLTESVLLRSALSSVLMERAGDMLVVPTYSLETDADENTVNLINKYELREIFEALPKVIDLILPLRSEEITAEHVTNILDDETFNSLLDNGNKIVEGTISNALITVFMDNGNIVIPRKLEKYEEWITVAGVEGELRKFINTIKTLELDVAEMMDDGLDKDSIFEKLKELESEKIERLLESGIFHYTASDMLTKGGFSLKNFEVIVPLSSYSPLVDDNLEKVIRQDELASVFIELKGFGLTSGMTNESIVRKLVEKKEDINKSNIISASVVNFIVGNEKICSSLSVPQKYIDAGSKDELADYGSANVWRKELPNMIEAIDEIFEISTKDDAFEFNSETISEKTNNLLKSLNEPSKVKAGSTRLDVCYASDILKNNITTELDKALKGVVKDDVIESAKDGGYYTKAELRALSETAGIFDLDILNIDNGELTEKVKNEILNINEIRPDDSQNRTTLDIMYPSAIIRYFVTDEIDKALNGDDQTDESLIEIEVRNNFKENKVYPKGEISALVNALEALGIDDIDKVNSTDQFTSLSKYRNNIDVICESGIVTGIITKQIDGALKEDLIDAEVKRQIKGSNQSYSKDEISNLVAALDELGLTDFNEFDSIDINDIKGESKTESGKTKLDVIYESDIVVGAITKKVKDTCNEEKNELVYHESANRDDLAVLKKREINALLALLGDVALDDFDIGKVSLSSVREQLIPDDKGNPQSFLISSNVTDTLVSNEQLYVPSSVYNKNKLNSNLIDADEQLRFVDALIALQGDTNIDEWKVEEDMVLPKSENRDLVLASVIMRATFSHHVFTTNSSIKNIVFSQSSVDLSSPRITVLGETVSKLPIISTEQLDALFNLVEGFNGAEGSKLEIPNFSTLDGIKESGKNIDLLCAFEVTRFNMSEVILNELGYIRTEIEEYIYNDDCYVFTANGDRITWTSPNVETLKAEGIVKIVSGQL
ncbi:MAG: MFS transporter, partial [Clostridia bacterium]|nr:MFS transporter [Clostridia bacterium]